MAMLSARLFDTVSRPLLLAGGCLGLLCLWSYWPTLDALVQRWSSDPQYSHGYLVPLFAVALLWLRSSQRAAVTVQLSWLGVPLLAAALLLRAAADFFFFDWLDGFSFIVCLAGLFALFGGAAALRWAWPGLAFLLFMIPLPFAVEMALAYPLRTVATIASNYALQTFGLPAVAQGHTIILEGVRLGVAEACSGLSMLVIFIALSTAVAIVVQRPLLDRLIIVLSAVPVALLANITRITVTGLMHQWVGRELADLVFHDLAGWLMMPFALILLWLELALLSRLFVEQTPQGPMPLALADAAGGSGRGARR
jgi:exosortase